MAALAGWQWWQVAQEETRTRQALNKLTEEEARTSSTLAEVTANQEQLRVEKKNTVESLNAMTDDVVERLFRAQKELNETQKEFLRNVIKRYEQATATRSNTAEGQV